jgi:hypothetical protein
VACAEPWKLLSGSLSLQAHQVSGKLRIHMQYVSSYVVLHRCQRSVLVPQHRFPCNVLNCSLSLGATDMDVPVLSRETAAGSTAGPTASFSMYMHGPGSYRVPRSASAITCNQHTHKCAVMFLNSRFSSTSHNKKQMPDQMQYTACCVQWSMYQCVMLQENKKSHRYCTIAAASNKRCAIQWVHCNINLHARTCADLLTCSTA